MTRTVQESTLRGVERAGYMAGLDASLAALSRALALGKDDRTINALRDYGAANRWHWERMPTQEERDRSIAGMVERVRSDYNWLADVVGQPDPTRNRAWFENVEVSTISGLPWVYQMMELHRLRNEADKELERLPAPEDSVRRMAELLLGDTTPIEDVEAAAQAIARDGMRRSFLEQVRKADLISWDPELSRRPTATRRVVLGGEELWTLTHCAYAPATGQHHLYVVDAWQDIIKPEITADANGAPKVSDGLASAFRFATNNDAWYILQSLDNSFEGLHPVHVTRAVIGPYEHRWSPRVEKPLEVTRRILKADQDAAFLRCKRQYALAPNHEERKDGSVRQIVYREDWHEELIVTPGKHVTAVSAGVQGTQVRVIER